MTPQGEPQKRKKEKKIKKKKRHDKENEKKQGAENKKTKKKKKQKDSDGVAAQLLALTRCQLPVPAMPKLARAKDGTAGFERAAFLRTAYSAIADSARPAESYLPGPRSHAVQGSVAHDRGRSHAPREGLASAAQQSGTGGKAWRRTFPAGRNSEPSR